jgi:hypothetical protein
MKKLLTASLLGFSLSFGAMAASAATLSVETTPISEIAATPEGKAALDKNLPGLTTHQSYDRFKSMSLKEVQPMSRGLITDTQLKALQADLDKLNK